jgi:glycosyltransferase involved in cell wall biosynthesis
VRILRIIARLNVGGPARHVVIANAGLRDRGHETLLAFGSVGPGEESLAHLVETAALPFVRLESLNPRVRPAGDAAAFLEILKTIRSFKPDIIHTHTAKAGALGRTAAWLTNLTRRGSRGSVVHTFHGHVLEGYFGATTTQAIRATERALARITDRILVVSERQRHDIVERFRITSPYKVKVVPLGLDLEPFRRLPLAPGDSARTALGIAEDAFAIGYAGRLVPIKNIPFLIEGFARFREHHPAVLLLAGDGTDRRNIESAVRNRGLSRDVRFLGWCSDLPAFYSALDTVVLTSKNEGTPVALIEAMASGRAVLATDAGGVADVVHDGVTGLLVPSGDPLAFAAGLRRLADDTQLRRQLGAAAREDVCVRYAARRLVSDLERVYRELSP